MTPTGKQISMRVSEVNAIATAKHDIIFVVRTAASERKFFLCAIFKRIENGKTRFLGEKNEK
jgi:hypothetical protein